MTTPRPIIVLDLISPNPNVRIDCHTTEQAQAVKVWLEQNAPKEWEEQVFGRIVGRGEMGGPDEFPITSEAK